MSIWEKTVFGLTLGVSIGFFQAPAQALRMDLRNARQGCGNLVTQAHPDLKGKQRGEEIKKCKGDPDAYSKAAGF